MEKNKTLLNIQTLREPSLWVVLVVGFMACTAWLVQNFLAVSQHPEWGLSAAAVWEGFWWIPFTYWAWAPTEKIAVMQFLILALYSAVLVRKWQFGSWLLRGVGALAWGGWLSFAVSEGGDLLGFGQGLPMTFSLGVWIAYLGFSLLFANPMGLRIAPSLKWIAVLLGISGTLWCIGESSIALGRMEVSNMAYVMAYLMGGVVFVLAKLSTMVVGLVGPKIKASWVLIWPSLGVGLLTLSAFAHSGDAYQMWRWDNQDRTIQTTDWQQQAVVRNPWVREQFALRKLRGLEAPGLSSSDAWKVLQSSPNKSEFYDALRAMGYFEGLPQEQGKLLQKLSDTNQTEDLILRLNAQVFKAQILCGSPDSSLHNWGKGHALALDIAQETDWVEPDALHALAVCELVAGQKQEAILLLSRAIQRLESRRRDDLLDHELQILRMRLGQIEQGQSLRFPY